MTDTREPDGTGLRDHRIRVMLCDDHALFRRGAAIVIGAEPDIDVVGEADSGEMAIELARELRPDVLLMDVRMRGIDGIAATKRIVDELGDGAPRIIVLTTFDLDEAVARAVAAGASGFVLKATEPELLVAAIRTVHAGNQLFAANATAELIQRHYAAGLAAVARAEDAPNDTAGEAAPAAQPSQAPNPSRPPAAAEEQHPSEPPSEWLTLSEREQEIFLLAARGLSNAEIGTRAFVSPGTVKTHISHILRKLGLRDRIQLVVYGYEHGLLPVQPGVDGRSMSRTGRAN